MTEAGPHFVDPSIYVDDERIRLYRYYCPGCAAQLALTVARSDEETLSEYEIRS